MSSSLLITKLYFPPARPNLVPRSRLVQRLNAGLDGPLILIAAPAGYGKTTLLGEWRTKEGENIPVAWLSLDTRDNDLASFLLYLTAAFDSVQTGLVENASLLLQSSQLPPVEVICTALLNELSAFTGDLILVLDDYHLITTPEIHAALTFLLDHLPPHVHLVILTRANPPLPLARMRARGHLTEIRAADLRFSTEEAALFLNEAMGLNLSTQEVAALEARTEGWIAGLQLAALSMQGREDVQGFISAFTGSHHYIVDYLAEEVLNCQPQDVREFLLKTSVLERLTGSLCDALTGRADGQATLERLAQSNLFLVPLDDERRWYRYHHLFAELLAHFLRMSQPENIPQLHRQAAIWHEKAGLTGEAVRYALLAQDYDHVALLIRQHGVRMAREYKLTDLLQWIEALPESQLNSDPNLNMIRVYVLWSLRRIDEVEICLDDIQHTLDQRSAAQPEYDDPEHRLLLANVLAIRSRVAVYRKDMESAIRLANQALELAPEDAYFLRAITYPGLYIAHRDIGEIEKAIRICEQAIHYAKLADHRVLTVDAIANLGAMHVVRGRLLRALEIYREGLRYLEDLRQTRMPAYNILYMALAQALCKQNDLEAAENYIDQALVLSEKSGRPINQLDAQIIHAEIRYASGDKPGALNILDKAYQQPITGSGWLQDGQQEVALMQARMHAELGNPIPAIEMLDSIELHIGDKLRYQEGIQAIHVTHLLLALNRLEEALGFLGQLAALMERAGHNGWLIEVLVLQSIAWYRRKETSRALAALEKALILAEPEGYMRAFLDSGEPMWVLLKMAGTSLQGATTLNYVRKLLGAFGDQPGHPLPAQQTHQLLIDPLSGRELEVLGLIAEGRSNKEIASELVIAIGTVKRHTVNIFNKLDVRNRTEAVAKARELELL